MALEYPDSFFATFDLLTSPDFRLSKSATEAQTYENAIATLVAHGYTSEPGAQASLELSVSLHAATPKIEAFYQYYTDVHGLSSDDACLSWVDWYGEKICDAGTLKSRLSELTADTEYELLSLLYSALN